MTPALGRLKSRGLQRLEAGFVDPIGMGGRLLRRAHRAHGRPWRVLLVPPYAPGSLGDEAIMMASIDYLEQRGVDRIGVVEYSANGTWSGLRPSLRPVYLPWHSRLRFLSAPHRLAAAVAEYDEVLFLGTDVLDGLYSERDTATRLALARLTARTGTPTSIVSFSLDRPTRGARAAWSRLPPSVRLRPRDPLSAARLSHWLRKPNQLSADLAFLLQPAEGCNPVRALEGWTQPRRSSGRVLVGVNLNGGAAFYSPEQGSDAVVRLYRRTLVELARMDVEFSFVLLPHDWRGHPSDNDLAVALFESLPEEIRRESLHVPGPYRAAEAKAMCGHLDLAITGRMHLAVAALGRGVPTVCVPHQERKIMGLLQHVGTGAAAVDLRMAARRGNFADQLISVIRNRRKLREEIQAELPRLKRLAELNLTP